MMRERSARIVLLAACLAAVGTSFVAGNAVAAPTGVTITKTNDANHDGVFHGTETVPANATYPWTVTYKLTIFGGTTNGPAGPFHTIMSITDNRTTGLGTCGALIGTTIAVNATETCTYTVTLAAPGTAGLVNTASLTYDVNALRNDTTRSSSTVNFPQLAAMFVIGNLNSAIGTSVTFWGAQWWKLNSLTGGTAPAAFKGFQTTPITACGQTWTTRPGNSPPPPPGPLPAYIVIIVSSSITRSGPVISGDVQHLVLVKTNSGYAPNPGHAGTGTVVSQIC
jgi:hypothetical protein